ALGNRAKTTDGISLFEDHVERLNLPLRRHPANFEHSGVAQHGLRVLQDNGWPKLRWAKSSLPGGFGRTRPVRSGGGGGAGGPTPSRQADVAAPTRMTKARRPAPCISQFSLANGR